MKNKRFVVLGDLIADLYYNGTKLIGIDGGSSRFNVIANLSCMGCKNIAIGGCGNDKIGETIIKRFENLGVDTSEIFARDKTTRAYHLIVDKSTLPKIRYKCIKDSPQNGESTWYEDSLEDIEYYCSKIREEDVIVFDELDEFSLEVIDKFECDKVLDIGNFKRLSRLEDSKIFLLKDKIEILQLNERVVPYLMQRFKCEDISDIYNFFRPKLMIVTRGREGADFVFDNKVFRKKLTNRAEELDATGAGDAFLSVFIKEYYDSSKRIDYEFINRTFFNATVLTSEVVRNIGARGHLHTRFLRKSNIQYEKEDVEL